MEIKIKEEMLKEFNELMALNNNDYKKCLLTMAMRRVYYLLNFSETILKLYSGDTSALKDIREEIYDIDRLLKKSEIEEGK